MFSFAHVALTSDSLNLACNRDHSLTLNTTPASEQNAIKNERELVGGQAGEGEEIFRQFKRRDRKLALGNGDGGGRGGKHGCYCRCALRPFN